MASAVSSANYLHTVPLSETGQKKREEVLSFFGSRLVNELKGPFENRSRPPGHTQQEGIALDPSLNFSQMMDVVKGTLQMIDSGKVAARDAMDSILSRGDNIGLDEVKEFKRQATIIADLNDRGVAITQIYKPIITECGKALKEII